MSNTHEEWRATWDWAEQVWGGKEDGSFNRFFRTIAQKVAEAEEWEELGSSDVWCATEWMVNYAKREGVTTREAFVERVLGASGYFYGMELSMLTIMYKSAESYNGVTQLFS